MVFLRMPQIISAVRLALASGLHGTQQTIRFNKIPFLLLVVHGISVHVYFMFRMSENAHSMYAKCKTSEKKNLWKQVSNASVSSIWREVSACISPL